jgi:hypothetical protein
MPRVQQWLQIPDSFFPLHCPIPTEDKLQPLNESEISTLSLKHIKFYLAFWVSFCFGKKYAHKIKNRETLYWSYNDLNKTDDAIRYTESFFALTELFKGI